jgi:hypothetical protein
MKTIVCTTCSQNFDNALMYYNPPTCPKCREEEYNKKQKLRQANAVSGLVEVSYGIHCPAKDGGHGYAYNTSMSVNVGDIVLVPGTFVHPEPQEATIVSTFSDYRGPCRWITSMLVPASQRKEAA